MKVLKLISLLLFVSLLLASGVAIAVAGQEKVTLCHKPGTPAEGTLEVAEAAVQAHLDHGDVLGACAPPALDGCTALNDPTLDGIYISAEYHNLIFEGDEVVTITGEDTTCMCSAGCLESQPCGGWCGEVRTPPVVSTWKPLQAGIYYLFWTSCQTTSADWDVHCTEAAP